TLEPLLGVGRGHGDDRALLVAEGAERAVAQAEAGDRVEEAGRPHAAAVFAVGNGAEAEALLEAHQFDDGFVLDLSIRLGCDRAGLGLARGVEKALGPKEAADVLDAEGRVQGRVSHCNLQYMTCRRSLSGEAEGPARPRPLRAAWRHAGFAGNR